VVNDHRIAEYVSGIAPANPASPGAQMGRCCESLIFLITASDLSCIMQQVFGVGTPAPGSTGCGIARYAGSTTMHRAAERIPLCRRLAFVTEGTEALPKCSA